MIKIDIQSQYTLDRPISGTSFDTDTQAKVDLLKQYMGNLIMYESESYTRGGITTVKLFSDGEKDFDIDHLNLIMSFEGSQVEGWRPYVKIAEADINNEVPEGLPNRVYSAIPEYEDEEGNVVSEVPERVKTWNEWFLNFSRNGVQGNYTATLNDGYWYYNLNYVSLNDDINGTELLLIHNSVDAELVDSLPVIE